MELKDLLQTGANVSLTVSLNDLKELFKEVVGVLPTIAADSPAEEYWTRKEVLQRLNIDPSTLWNWEKTGYIKSYPFGGRKRYLQSDVEAIRTGKKKKTDERDRR